MYIANPTMSVYPTVLECGASADITVGFEAGSAFYHHPSQVVLLIDRSVGITEEEMTSVKAAAKQFIHDISVATTIEGANIITSQSTLWISSFADTVINNSPLSYNVSELNAAVDAIKISNESANYKKAFESADKLFWKQTKDRRIVVLFSHSAQTALLDTDPVVKRMKSEGTKIFCVGLLDNPEKLNLWASDEAKDHVSYTASHKELNKAFHEIAAEVVLAGVIDGELTQTVNNDFKIIGYDEPTDGSVEIAGNNTITWSIPQAALAMMPVKPSLTYHVEYTGKKDGRREMIKPASYHDRYGNKLDYPAAQIEVKCSGGGIVYPESCPTPTDFTVSGCADAQTVILSNISMLGLGRIIKADVTIKAVCPNKRIAVSLILTERDADAVEHFRGVKHILVPAQNGNSCNDVTIKCIQFSLPEELDTSGNTGSICNARNFSIRVISNYIDTDFTCCS